MAALTSDPTSTLTYEAYLAEPEVQGRYDIIEGARVFQPEISWGRQRIIGNFIEPLSKYERTYRSHAVISPFDILIHRALLQTRQPDFLLISHERLMQAGGPPKIGPLEIGPELVVEIISDSEAQRVLEDKLADYCEIGVSECWVVRPETRTVEVLALSANEVRSVAVYTETQVVISVVFEKLSVTVADIFAE